MEGWKEEGGAVRRWGVADKLERRGAGGGGGFKGARGEKKTKKECELLCSCISVMFPSFWFGRH